VYDHDRGRTDDEIKAIAATGGLIGICFMPMFLDVHGNMASVLNHIDYAVKLIGVDHVAIGTDHTYLAPDPEGTEWREMPRSMPNYSAGWRAEHRIGLQESHDELHEGSLAWTNWPLITVGLTARGYSDEDIQKILGLNMLRVLQDTEPR